MSETTPPLAQTFETSRYPEVFVVSGRRHRPYWLHALLLLLTTLSTLIVGAQLAFNYQHRLPAFEFGMGSTPLFHPRWIWHNPSLLLSGVPFSATLMGILMAHEMGHFILCEKNGVYATLPFFIPAPTLIGTMGAFIRIKSPIRSRQALFDIGVAGPIAGFVVAIPFLFIGLLLSHPLPGFPEPNAYAVGFPLIFHVAHRIIVTVTHNPMPMSRLSLHPIAVAAWVGMFATALNLLPGGQLDGGHIVYAVAPQWHKRITRISVLVLAFLGIYWPAWGTWAWPGWALWAVVLGLTGWRHPHVPVWPGLDPMRRWLAVMAVIILLLTFLPAPFVGQSFF